VDEAAVPCFHKPRLIPFALREKVEQQLQKQVDEGELIPVDRSDWAIPIVVVNKKDEEIRICGDFKVSINPVIKSQVYPLPTPEKMFSALANGEESYTKLDLARAYKQMKVQKLSQPLLTINTHRGLYQYMRLPFGIQIAPLWQKAVAQVLSSLSGVVCYINDILVTGHTREKHAANL